MRSGPAVGDADAEPIQSYDGCLDMRTNVRIHMFAGMRMHGGGV